jgi:hypothetical protein
MAQKYTPLNLSFLQNQYSPQADSIRNTAAMIMANAGWSQPAQATLKEIAKQNAEAKKKYNSAHKQTFLSSVFDALQTPLYGVANALDEALAGHQSDNNDSVLADIGKTIGGGIAGAAKGVGAGLRGATGIVDALPGVDINDEWQSDPTDKTHFSDVAIRKELHMSTEDAMKPENWAKVKDKLQEINKIPWYEKTLFQAAVPDNLDSPDAREKYFRNEMLAGLPIDIGADPMNFIAPGIGALSKTGKSAEAITEGVDAARAASSTVAPILEGLKLKNVSELAPKAALDEAAPISAVTEGATIPATDIKLSSVPPGKTLDFKTLSNIGRRESGSEPGVTMTPRDQKAVAAEIAKMAGMGQPSWMQRASQYLQLVDEGNKWTHTYEFLQKADRAVKSKGLRHNPAKMAPVLLQAIKKDLVAARPVTREIERRVTNRATADEIVIHPSPARLKVPEARLANKVVRKFEGEILGRRMAPGTGEALAKAIAEGRNVRYSGPQQARMWNQITSSLKFSDARKFNKAVRVLRSVENYFISKGVIPHSAAKTSESVPLRLSQVAEALGPQFLGKSHAFITGILRGDPKSLAHLSPDQIEALQKLRASEATVAAPAVKRGIEVGKDAVDNIAKLNLSAGRKKDLFTQAQKSAGIVAAAEGAGDVGAHVAKNYVGNLTGVTDPINTALRSNNLKTEAWLGKVGRTGQGIVNDADFLGSVTKAISKAADLPAPKSLSGAIGAAARVGEWLGARFNAAYGVQDMRPIFEVGQAGAMSTTARRARLINELGRRFDPSDADLWHEAFRTAQQNGIATGKVAELQSEIAKVMENLFGGSGLRSGAIADSTVIGRNRLLLDELNKNLKRFGLGQFKFEAGKVTDAAGVTHDFSKGLDWMRSWEAWNVTKPYDFLHKVQNAVEHTVREKGMFDEIASRFGSPTKHGDVKFGVDHPRLAGYFFNKEGATQARTFVRMLDEASTPNSKSLQYFDHVLSKLKASLTIYIPGHHMTNLIGDMYYNWIAGVNKPQRYEQAIKVMLAQKGRYGEFAEIGKLNPNSIEALSGPKALEQAVARSMVKPDAGLSIPAKGNSVVVTMQNGTKVTADMIYTAAFRQGILPSARVLEDVTSDTSSILDKFRPLGGRGQRGVHEVSEIRDHIPRLAQFIDGIIKHKGSFTSAVESSARSVRKWHPDGLGLTKFEKTVMKRVFPFYSWTRKAIPLAIESAVFNSPKVMAYPRLMEAIGLANGVTPTEQGTDPFPGDQLFPDWLRNRGIGPIAGAAGSYLSVNPSTPVLDVLSLLGQPGQSALDMANPMGKVPVEIANGQTLGRNVPIGNTNGQWADYFAKQIPVASQLGRASGQFGVSDSTKAEGFPNWTNILNLLTGAKIVNTGKYQKSAEFDLRDYLKQKGQQQGR